MVTTNMKIEFPTMAESNQEAEPMSMREANNLYFGHTGLFAKAMRGNDTAALQRIKLDLAKAVIKDSKSGHKIDVKALNISMSMIFGKNHKPLNVSCGKCIPKAIEKVEIWLKAQSSSRQTKLDTEAEKEPAAPKPGTANPLLADIENGSTIEMVPAHQFVYVVTGTGRKDVGISVAKVEIGNHAPNVAVRMLTDMHTQPQIISMKRVFTTPMAAYKAALCLGNGDLSWMETEADRSGASTATNIPAPAIDQAQSEANEEDTSATEPIKLPKGTVLDNGEEQLKVTIRRGDTVHCEDSEGNPRKLDISEVNSVWAIVN